MSEWDWVEAQPKGWLTSADPEPPPHEHPWGTSWVRLSATLAMSWRTNPVFGLRSHKSGPATLVPSRPGRLTFPRQNP